ncbi:MAG: hypothetical protein U5L96_05695 [Owenweeksia sp.]|nr:hypothetical protein [Owenweeksia sp.]
MDAIKKPTGVFNCQLSDDVLLSELVSPLPGKSTNCFGINNIPVKIKLTNQGVNDAYNIAVAYNFNNGITGTDTISDTIAPGNSLIYTFSNSSLNLTTGINYSMDTYIAYAADQNAYNDTLRETIEILNGQTKTIPYQSDFEAFSQCGTQSTCGFTTCTLSDGWINLDNGVDDEIDFRVNSGPTPSSGTGPALTMTQAPPTGTICISKPQRDVIVVKPFYFPHACLLIPILLPVLL